MIYFGKYEQVEYWLYTATGCMYSCEETGDGLVWGDANGWDLGSEFLCEKLTNTRALALEKMPKRFELEAEITHTEDEVYICYQTFNMWNKIKESYSNRTKVKVIFEEVQE